MRTVGIAVASFMFGMIAGNACTQKTEQPTVVATMPIVVEPTVDAGAADASVADAGAEPMTVKPDAQPSLSEVPPTVETK